MHRPPLLLVIPLLAALALGACSKSERVIGRLDDAKRAKIGVMTGTTGEAAAKGRFPEAEVKSFDDVMDAIAAMRAGQLEAVVTSYPTAFQVSKKNRELTIIEEPLAHEDSSVAVKKGNAELLAEANRIIAGMKSDGTLASMKKRWFKDGDGPYDEPNIELPATGTPLRIGASATREPFQFVDQGGQITGHDGELGRRIGAGLGRPIEFSNMKFMALIPALQSGKIDMIVSGMTATDARRQFVDFSEPYFQNSQVMLVKKPAGAIQTTSATKKMVSAAEIADKRIGVLTGSAHDTYATKTYPNAKILQYRTAADIALGVKTGKVDVALYDEEPLRDMLRDDPTLGILGESLFSFTVGVGFNKNSEELRLSFNRFLAEAKKNGVYADMVDRWITKRETQDADAAADAAERLCSRSASAPAARRSRSSRTTT